VSVACVTLTGPSRAQHKAAVREPNCCTIFGGSPYSIFSPWREIEFSSLSMQICPSRGSPQPQQGLDRLPPQARGAGPNPGRAHLPLMHKSSRQVTGAPGEWPVPQAGLTSTCSVPPRRVGLDPPQKRQDPAPSSNPSGLRPGCHASATECHTSLPWAGGGPGGRPSHILCPVCAPPHTPLQLVHFGT
jgi:hypothetical protein